VPDKFFVHFLKGENAQYVPGSRQRTGHILHPSPFEDSDIDAIAIVLR